jgi:hypothetical protein
MQILSCAHANDASCFPAETGGKHRNVRSLTALVADGRAAKFYAECFLGLSHGWTAPGSTSCPPCPAYFFALIS